MIRNLPIGINWRILRAEIRRRLRYLRGVDAAFEGWDSTEIEGTE